MTVRLLICFFFPFISVQPPPRPPEFLFSFVAGLRRAGPAPGRGNRRATSERPVQPPYYKRAAGATATSVGIPPPPPERGKPWPRPRRRRGGGGRRGRT